MKKLKVVEVFYSIQGEGANFGMPAVFIRLSHCNKTCSYCDTNWNIGEDMSVEELYSEVKRHHCSNIIWTGGEPTLQLTEDVLIHFKEFYNCIETNGTNPVPKGIDYISCSPKVSVEELKTNVPFADELRFPIAAGDYLPDVNLLPKASKYLVSPIFDDEELNHANLEYCVLLVKNNTPWRLSMQTHKLLNIR